MRAALISLEPWDAIWRRNQHLSAELVLQGLLGGLDFIEPPVRHPAASPPDDVPGGIRIIRPRLTIPKRAGGLRLTGRQLRRRLRQADVVWVNDPAFGVHCLSRDQAVLYDVTDDWRTYDFPPRIIRRIVRAEDHLAQRAATVVCSPTLRHRWNERYDVDAAVIPNGIDAAAWKHVPLRELPGSGPHVGYIGTIQSERLDIGLVLAIADQSAVGTVHLVGPDALDEDSRQRLTAHPRVMLHGPVPAGDVPSWTASMDVLVCPHRITPFTLSLDAIKAREYLASGRPIVATPTSGFQEHALRVDLSVSVCETQSFPDVVSTAVTSPRAAAGRALEPMSWAERARELYRQIERATSQSGAIPARTSKKE